MATGLKARSEKERIKFFKIRILSIKWTDKKEVPSTAKNWEIGKRVNIEYWIQKLKFQLEHQIIENILNVCINWKWCDFAQNKEK